MSNRTLRLLFLDDALPVGGQEILLLTQLKTLDRSKFAVHLVTQTHRGALLEAAQELADHYYCLKRRFRLDPSAVFRLRRYLIENRIDIVHSNNWLASLYLLIAASGVKVIRIAAVHGYDRTFRMGINLFTMGKFEKVLCVSRSQMLDLYKNGIPLEKMAVVHNCFDAARFSAGKSMGNRSNPFKIVMVANIRKIKDQETLIRAGAILGKRGRDFRIFLVGEDAGNMAACKRLVKETALEERVLFTGARGIDSRFLSGFDLFVSSSLMETFGIAVLEAMATKLPVLVSDIPSSMELVQHGRSGFFFEAHNPVSCADKIEYLMENPHLLDEMAENGFERARDFLPAKTIKDLEDLYCAIYNKKNQIRDRELIISTESGISC